MAEVVITYLEMTEPPLGPPLPWPAGVTAQRLCHPSVDYYRFLYDWVGGPYNWKDRKAWNDDRLREHLGDPEVAVYVLMSQGCPAGFCELDAGVSGQVQIVYFGLTPDFVGRGLGCFWLDWTVRKCWQRAPDRVWVHTCTEDHPAALPLYQRFGLKPYASENRVS